MTSTRRHSEPPAFIAGLLSKDLTPVEFRVWLYLHWRRGRNDSSWPSQDIIARDLGLTKDAVRKIIRRLEGKGWLHVHKPERQGRGQYLRYTTIQPQKGQPAVYPSDTEDQPAIWPLEVKRPASQAEKGQPAEPRYKEEHSQGTHTSSLAPKSDLLGPPEQSPTPTKTTKPKPQAKTTSRPAFIAPTIDEVRAYAESRGLPDFDAEKFVAYYAAADWHDGQGNAVRNWKQKFLSVWEKNAKGQTPTKREPQRGDPDWYPTEEEAEAVLREVGLMETAP